MLTTQAGIIPVISWLDNLQFTELCQNIITHVRGPKAEYFLLQLIEMIAVA
jgi:hypothetical protein